MLQTNKHTIVFVLAALFSVLSGSAKATDAVKHPLAVGDKVRVSTLDSTSNRPGVGSSKVVQGYVASLLNGKLLVCTRGSIRVDRATRIDGSVVEFSYIGAQYDSLTRSLAGTDKQGNAITIALAEIDHVDVTQLTKDGQISSVIHAKTLHHRLRFITSYPLLLLETDIDSLVQIKRWDKGSSYSTGLGMILGGLAGYLYGETTAEDPEPPRGFEIELIPGPSRDTQIVLSTLSGLVIGGVIGNAFGKGRWKEIPLNNVKLNVQPTLSGGIGLSLALRF